MTAPPSVAEPRVLGSGPLGRSATVALAVVAVDLASKSLARALLGTATIELPAGGFLRLVYNDGFARGASLGALTLPATFFLAAALLYMMARVCAPMAALDRLAPVALGLVAGATVGNASDLLLTGRGVVDFLGVPTAQGALVFNLADVAAYVGVALLARTFWILARLAWERGVGGRAMEVAPRYPRLHAAAEAAWAAHRASAPRAAARPVLEVVRSVPVFTEGTEGDTATAPRSVEQPPASLPIVPTAPAAQAAPRLTLVRGGPAR